MTVYGRQQPARIKSLTPAHGFVAVHVYEGETGQPEQRYEVPLVAWATLEDGTVVGVHLPRGEHRGVEVIDESDPNFNCYRAGGGAAEWLVRPPRPAEGRRVNRDR